MVVKLGQQYNVGEKPSNVDVCFSPHLVSMAREGLLPSIFVEKNIYFLYVVS